ncbi:MAG TPA: GNAT family N-acetyltransferase [Pedococcus sp.]|nr:GNAT family N-acetyltransferase [Pedococcus sp.]
MDTTTDLRVRMVEDHYVSVMRTLTSSTSSIVRRLPDEDVLGYVSDIPFPLFSGAVAPSFAPGSEVRRAEEVLRVLSANGQPFQWWAGPRTRSPAIEDLLSARGLVTGGLTPGMHADLAAVDLTSQHGAVGEVGEVAEVGVTVCATEGEWLAANRVFVEAFELPGQLLDVFTRVWRDVPGLVQLVARLEGEPVGCAAGVALDGVMGVYNVGTVEAARRRGVGRALTAAMMRIGRDQGCHSAILHASELGYPVYESLGFDHVTDVSQYVWLPPS